ncbi:MAG: hypothetical protein R6X12_09125 [bacterium]
MTVVAWLLILQAGFGAAGSGIEFALRPLLVPPEARALDVPGAEELVPGYRVLSPLVRLLEALIWAGLAFNAALLAGAVGLLRRRKWGWYAVVVLHILAAGGLFTVLPTAFGGVLGVAAPGASPFLPWLLSGLAVLPALVLIGFLLLDPVVGQFEAGGEPAPPA